MLELYINVKNVFNKSNQHKKATFANPTVTALPPCIK